MAGVIEAGGIQGGVSKELVEGVGPSKSTSISPGDFLKEEDHERRARSRVLFRYVLSEKDEDNTAIMALWSRTYE